MKQILQAIRAKFSKQETPKDKVFPRKFLVEVNIDHPRIIPHVITAQIVIDAHDRQHAIKQIHEDCKITVGRVLVMKKKIK
jgi:hypothetical protein